MTFTAGLNKGYANKGLQHLRGDQDDTTMTHQPQTLTLYWQAIVTRKLAVL